MADDRAGYCGYDAPKIAAIAPEPAADGSNEGMHWDEEFGWYRKDTRVWTMNEIRDHPMFMEDMPRNIDENPLLCALQSVVYDGNTDEEMAEHFRGLGNDAFRSSTNHFSSQNALQAYTKGLEMECKDSLLNSQLHSNRAAVSLRLKEYEKAVYDCRIAVKLDPSNVKAYFRAVKASEALGLTAQALAFCTDAKSYGPKENDIVKTHAMLTKRLAKEDAERAKAKKADEAAVTMRNAVNEEVNKLLTARNKELSPLLFDMSMYTKTGAVMRPRIAQDENEDQTALEWPIIFIYDENGQTDFVETLDERAALEDQFQLMFPCGGKAHWDTEGKYVYDKLVAYLEVHTEVTGKKGTKFIPIDTTNMLAAALDKADILPLCLAAHVFVRGHASHKQWCKHNEMAE